ncbi:MAG: hypothetical protein M1358_06615 [Chloroflexi bacterium]|nr:hypothetical protein [Chloroflexota bacterium]
MARKTLERLLAEARRQEEEVLSMLKMASPEMETYDQFVRQLDRLQGLIAQLKAQIVGRDD